MQDHQSTQYHPQQQPRTKDKENCTDIGIFKDERQADDFAEALNIYRKSKK